MAKINTSFCISGHIIGTSVNMNMLIISYFVSFIKNVVYIRKRVLSAFLLIVLFHLSLLAGSVEKLNSLRCEYLTTPLGIDVLSPRLSWKLPVGVDVQKAYQLIVGTDSASVARGVGNSWDSGKVWASDVLVAYSGKAIQPYTRILLESMRLG